MWLLHVWDSNVKYTQFQEKVCEPSCLLLYYSTKKNQQQINKIDWLTMSKTKSKGSYLLYSNCIYIHLAWCLPDEVFYHVGGACVCVCVPFSSCPLVSGVPSRFVFWSLREDDGRVSLLEHLLNQSISAPLILVRHALLFHCNTTNTHLRWCSPLFWTESVIRYSPVHDKNMKDE